MSSEAPCRYLEWDSEFFGVRIARVEADRLTAEGAVDILDWCREQVIDCLYFLASSADTASTRVAEDNHFRLVDIRLTLERSLEPSRDVMSRKVDDAVRAAADEDLVHLRHIARNSFQDTRFYHDGNFSRERCDALYETWVEASYNGFADAVLVVDIGREPAGFITCKMVGPTHGEIGLVGVSPASQGIGVGRRLVEASLKWFAARGADQVRVVTQGRNVPAQRLYQRCGFVTLSTGLWYHRWFKKASEEVNSV